MVLSDLTSLTALRCRHWQALPRPLPTEVRRMIHNMDAVESLNANQQTESHLGNPNTTILHVEDDPHVARSISRLLQLKGFNVVSAATRSGVLQHITKNGLHPDLVLTDFDLSAEVTGDQLVAEILTYLKYKPPMIILTGVPLLQLQKAAPIADRILSKPVDSEVLLSEIQYLTAPRVHGFHTHLGISP